eukprot:GFUD01005557.1.p1 GENE.GFUD01005557.1~~GFUD01005557.1.p1  ORF type:complete len:298 (-),score=25.97 GFUD01005557.1:102-995(-)
MDLKWLKIISICLYILIGSLLCITWLYDSSYNVSLLKKGPVSVDLWSQEQAKRKERIDKVCQEHAGELYYDNVPLFPIRDNFNHIIFFPNYNVLHCGIPKAGSTTWTAGTFMKLADKLGIPYRTKSGRVPRVEFLAYFQIKDVETFNRILEGDPVSFTNVRHPFERLVSAYYDKIKPSGKMMFDQFVQYVLMTANATQNNKFVGMNPHWRPYNTLCAFCNINYKVISKMETFDEDKKEIMHMLGLEDEEMRLGVHIGNTIESTTRELFRNLTEEVKIALADLYKYDFAMFDYDPELY